MENAYSAQDVTDVGTEDNTYVGQTATGEYAVHKFNDSATSNSGTFTARVRSNQGCNFSTTYLQIYDFDGSVWETIDSDNTAAANTKFTLTGYKADLTNYKDGSGYTHCRVYQLNV